MTWLECGSNKNYLQTLCHCETVFELGYEETIINSRMQAVKGHLIHGLLNRWTSHWLFRGAKKYGWGGGAWDPNYDPGADFLDHNFLSSKNSG